MLHEIHIQNYAVIDNLRVDFQPGLNLLSGETGSGKSILVDALGLALGGRASPEVIRTGTDRATVTAIFRVVPGFSPAGAALKGGATNEAGAALKGGASGEGGVEKWAPWNAWLEEYGLAGEDEPEIILRREIQASGKSRLLVNDQPVTLVAVKALARSLVEIHGQNEHVALFAREAQLELLDQFGGSEATLEKVGELFARRRQLEREMESLSRNEQERLRTMDLLQFQAQEVERAQLHPGEDASLEDEKRVLGNLEKIRVAAASAFGQLYEEEGSACARLGSVSRGVEELRRYDARLEPYLEPLAGARAALEDLAFFLRDYLGKLEANPHRLEEVEDRLALMDRLKRKYGKTIEEMLAYRERARQQLSDLEHADERREELRHELQSATTEYQEMAQALSEQRRAAARRLEKLVRDELAQLGMEKTRFEIRFETLAWDDSAAAHYERRSETGDPRPTPQSPGARGGPRGIDEIDLLISPNPGEEMRPLERIASGGELSRLMLAVKTVVGSERSVGATRARQRLAPTFVFDEVDAGIGGRVAESVGQRLKRLALHGQVLCVTHLPQIACFADHHFYVEKFERSGRTVTAVKYLESQKARVQELARMLSGSQVTDAVLKHAVAMLKHASEL